MLTFAEVGDRLCIKELGNQQKMLAFLYNFWTLEQKIVAFWYDSFQSDIALKNF